MKKIVGLTVALIAVAAAAWVAVSFKDRIEEGREGFALLPPNQRTGPLEFLVETRDGVLESSQWRGRPVLVAVWASWCGPCLRSIPLLIDLQRDFSAKLTVVGLNVDSEGWPAVEQIGAAFPEINYRIALPSPRPMIVRSIVDLRPLGQVSVLPTAFLLDSDGRLAAKYVGSEAERAIRGDVERLLKQESGG